MTLDPERVYKALDELQASVQNILLYQKEQNGRVGRNEECIAINMRRLDTHDLVLRDHGERIVGIERGEQVEADWQREFRAETKQEQDWSRDRIVDLMKDVLPWVGLMGLIADKLLG